MQAASDNVAAWSAVSETSLCGINSCYDMIFKAIYILDASNSYGAVAHCICKVNKRGIMKQHETVRSDVTLQSMNSLRRFHFNIAASIIMMSLKPEVG